MATYHLHRWSLTFYARSPYLAPEQCPLSLIGYRDQESEPVHTSDIKKVNGREVTTRSGSIYILEDISVEYLAWLNDNNIEYDPTNPIKVKKVNING